MSKIVPLLLLLAFIATLLSQAALARASGTWRFAAMGLLLVLAPFAFAVGTSDRLEFNAGMAAIFWFAAFFIFVAIAPSGRRSGLSVSVSAMCALATVGMVVGALANPYRLGPIWQQTKPVQLGASHSWLSVDPPTANYLTDLQQMAQAHGFRLGTPVIDLTGASPGAVFALGGVAPGIPWLSGGYSGSVAYAREVLSQVPREELRRAWVLTSPGYWRALPNSVLVSVGLDFPEAYEYVGSLHVPTRDESQSLWKPKSERVDFRLSIPPEEVVERSLRRR